ncbi:MAG: hypothetical protein U0989_18700 [Azonexus sp.]|nr:hypothetical protein [Azonexus sp.]
MAFVSGLKTLVLAAISTDNDKPAPKKCKQSNHHDGSSVDRLRGRSQTSAALNGRADADLPVKMALTAALR